MNVLQIIPSLATGGAEQAVLDVNEALVQAGAGSFVASSGGPLVKTVKAAGGTHYAFPMAAKNPAIMLANAGHIADIVRAKGIDVIHARSRAPAWSAFAAARLTGVKFVTTFHAAYRFNNAAKKFYNSVMARGDAVIAISDFVAAHILYNYHVPQERVVTIQRGIDLARFRREEVGMDRIAALRAAWGARPGQGVVLMPARLSRIKGQLILIDAMQRLTREHPERDILAVLIGDAQGREAYAGEIAAAIAAAGLNGKIRIAGHCEDMPAAYAASDMVAAPSLVAEGFGRAPVEAQAMGVPVVASALGGFKETVVVGETGWLTPSGDADALARAMIEILSLPEEEKARRAVRAVDHAHARFDKRKMAADTLAVYRNLMAYAGRGGDDARG